MLDTVIVIAMVLLVALAAVLAYAASKPDIFRVQRTLNIQAPAERIFPLLTDLRSFASWSPYEKKDPGMQRTYGGAPNGKGALYAWDGNRNIGKGSLEIADTSPPSRVTMKLDFVRPFECHNILDFTLEPKGDVTAVTWAMHGPMPFISKVMSVVCNMDKMVGNDFDAGLASLKAIAEK